MGAIFSTLAAYIVYRIVCAKQTQAIRQRSVAILDDRETRTPPLEPSLPGNLNTASEAVDDRETKDPPLEPSPLGTLNITAKAPEDVHSLIEFSPPGTPKTAAETDSYELQEVNFDDDEGVDDTYAFTIPLGMGIGEESDEESVGESDGESVGESACALTRSDGSLGQVQNQPKIDHLNPNSRAQTTEANKLTIHLSARLSHVEYGKFHDLDACLIILKLKFHSFITPTDSHLKSARIKATFTYPSSSHASSTAVCNFMDDPMSIVAFLSKSHPQVLCWAPAMAFGELASTNECTRWRWDVAMPIGNSLMAAVGTSFSSNIGRERAHQRVNRAVVTGNICGGNNNGMLLTVEESRHQEDGVRGIPRVLQVAMIVTHDGRPFHAEFRVSSQIGFTSDSLRWREISGKNVDPCIFIPGYERIPLGSARLGVEGVLDAVDLGALTGFSGVA